MKPVTIPTVRRAPATTSVLAARTVCRGSILPFSRIGGHGPPASSLRRWGFPGLGAARAPRGARGGPEADQLRLLGRDRRGDAFAARATPKQLEAVLQPR